MQPKSIIGVAVKALLLHNRRALIVRRSPSDRAAPGMWEFPGGKMEFGESPRDTALREIMEETGIAAQVIRPLYAETFKKSSTRQVVIINFICTCQSPGVRLSFEHTDYLWATRAQMLQLLDAGIVRNLERNNAFAQPEVDIAD